MISISAERYEKLEKEAKEMGIKLSDLLKLIINEYVDYEPPKPVKHITNKIKDIKPKMRR